MLLLFVAILPTPSVGIVNTPKYINDQTGFTIGVYVTQDINVNIIQEKFDIATKRLKTFSGTNWNYKIIRISSTHTDWQSQTNQMLLNTNEHGTFWKDVSMQTDFQKDYNSFDFVFGVTSQPLNFAKALGDNYVVSDITLFTGIPSISYTGEKNMPYGGAPIEHEILHHFGLDDIPDRLDSPTYPDCVMGSRATSDASNKINVCGKTLSPYLNRKDADNFLIAVGAIQPQLKIGEPTTIKRSPILGVVGTLIILFCAILVRRRYDS